MANYSTSELKPGIKILVNKEPFVVVSYEFVKPGKGQAFTRVKVKNLRTGRVLERTFKSGESVEAADAIETTIQYLYFDTANYVFMATDDSCDQYELNESIISDVKLWLVEGVCYNAVIWNDCVITVTPPNSIDLEVTETEPSIKGDTVSGGSKLAVLSTGASVRVPLFISVEDVIRVNPQDGEYISRV